MNLARPDHAREIRHAMSDPLDVCTRLGLIGARGTYTRQTGGGVLVRCPWHKDRTPSCSIRRGPDGTIAIKCHGCQATGDLFSLIAITQGLDTRTEFREVLKAAAEIGGLSSIANEIETGSFKPERPVIPPPPPVQERTYPPEREVMAVWQSADRVDLDAECVAWCESRSLDAETIADADLARAIPVTAILPRWASYHRESWTRTGHRMIVPMRDAHGKIRSVRATRIVTGEAPKRLPPGGCKATELVMADAFAVAMLDGTFKPTRVVITEGEPDFLTRATRKNVGGIVAVLGIVNGTWHEQLADRIPDMTTVIVRTDHDAAGDAYAQLIQASLKSRCFIQRGG